MNAIVPKGWCPSLYEPMASGDGLLVRIKPPGTMMTAKAARQLGAAAELYGNGVIELTNRAAIQIRGLSKMALAPFAAAIVAAGLADLDPVVERRRAVIVSPLAGGDVRMVAAEVEARLTRDPGLAVPPPAKFAVVVDGGGVLPLGDIGAYIHVACGIPDCAVMLMSTRSTVSVPTSEVADAVAHFVRMLPDVDARRSSVSRELKAVGWIDYGGSDRGAFGVGLPFGATTAGIMTSLSRITEQFGDGTLRVTPWRALVIPDVSSATITQLREACTALGLIVDQSDARLAVIACPGQPACVNATVPARADAIRLVAFGLPPTVHVSGCTKGCAHPGQARITLVGANGRYNIIRNGRPSDAPSLRDLTIDQAIAALRA